MAVENDPKDITQLCVEFAQLRGIDPVMATQEITKIVEVLLFNTTGLSGTYQRLREWAEKYQNSNVPRTIRLAGILGSRILIAEGLFEKLALAAEREGRQPQDLLVKILVKHFNDEPVTK